MARRFSTTSRIIPTGVGKSRAAAPRRAGSADHPHGRGEKGWAPILDGRPRGSSPRAWGKVKIDTIAELAGRIIPTGVGKR